MSTNKHFKIKRIETILAVDLGTTTGWALKNELGITSGSISFKQNRFQGGGMRYLEFHLWLNQLPEVNVIYFEKMRRHLGVDAARTYEGFLETLISWCEKHKIPYQGISVRTIKKFITGKCNASKVIKRTLGHRPIDDNEVDALALLHLAVRRKNQLHKNR